MLPGVSVHESIDPHLDARAACTVSEGIDPVPIDLGHPDAHECIVVYRLHMSSGMGS